MPTENGGLRVAVAVLAAGLGTEHVFSASLSSPWTTGKLSQSLNDQAAFWKLFDEACAASYALTAFVAFWLKDWNAFFWGMVTTTVIIIWLYTDYKRALSGELYQ